MTAFHAKKVKQGEIGEQLKAARSHMPWSVLSAARRAGLPKKIIIALENNDFSAIPGEVYVRNFLRRYARALGINPAPLIALLPSPVKKELRISRPPSRGWIALTAGARWIAMGAAAAGILIFITAEWGHLLRAPRLSIASPQNGMVVHSAILEVQGSVEPTAIVSMNGTPVVHSGDSFTATIYLKEGANTIIVDAERKHGRKTSVTRQVIFAPKLSERATTAQN